MPSGASRRGRRGGLEEARELAALLGSLSAQGRSLSLSTVAARLGCSTRHARLLLELALTAHDEEGMGLPIGLGDDDQLVLAFDSERKGHPLKLTPSESEAMRAALERLGMSQDDPIYQGVLPYLSPTGETGAEGRPQGPDVSGRPSVLDLCAQAIADGHGLGFWYRGAADAEPRKRRVIPQTLRTEEGAWYLEALDLEIQAQRTFRLDRMADPRPFATGEREGARTMGQQGHEVVREVAVDFLDQGLLELFSWHGMRVTGESEGRTSVTLPLYAGDWLPLRLAACGSSVVIRDEDLRARVREAARALRAAATKTGQA